MIEKNFISTNFLIISLCFFYESSASGGDKNVESIPHEINFLFSKYDSLLKAEYLIRYESSQELISKSDELSLPFRMGRWNDEIKSDLIQATIIKEKIEGLLYSEDYSSVRKGSCSFSRLWMVILYHSKTLEELSVCTTERCSRISDLLINLSSISKRGREAIALCRKSIEKSGSGITIHTKV